MKNIKKIKKPIQIFFEIKAMERDVFNVLQIGVFDYRRNRQNFVETYLPPRITAMNLILEINNCIKKLNQELMIRNYNKKKKQLT